MVFRHSKSKCSKLDKNNVEKDNNVDIKDESSGNSKEDEGFVEILQLYLGFLMLPPQQSCHQRFVGFVYVVTVHLGKQKCNPGAAAAFIANPLWVVNTRLQVENSVVGAPCGVMDQMAFVSGEATNLLAMVCQIFLGLVGQYRDMSIVVLPLMVARLKRMSWKCVSNHGCCCSTSSRTSEYGSAFSLCALCYNGN
ncbi:alpha,alpha-trehalose-phosphate synthase [Tanacetum coccineum]